MENFAHTLLGLSLAKAGLERATPLATTALVVSSNLPDIDVVMRVGGDTTDYLHYHRGFTHSFVGLALLAVGLTLLLTWLDRKFRLRRDHRRRPLRPLRIFWIAYLGGLGHTFMDFTNAYGVRPLLPFSNRWLYGDLAYVVDPWIWLILGSAVVWLTTTDGVRAFIWLMIGILLALAVALALRNPTEMQPAVPTLARVIWFVGFAIVVAGALMGWGRMGERVARYSLVLLAVYYGGMWLAHQSAMQRARTSLPEESVNQLAAWPVPANPLMWQAAAATGDSVYTRFINLLEPHVKVTGPTEARRAMGLWTRLDALDLKFIEALGQSQEAREFLSFARFASAKVEERQDGYAITMRDLRFNLQMRAELDRDLVIQSTDVKWF
jgi:membrane-bound metal-dependent hydrolase YbcI (DUF457 family)